MSYDDFDLEGRDYDPLGLHEWGCRYPGEGVMPYPHQRGLLHGRRNGDGAPGPGGGILTR